MDSPSSAVVKGPEERHADGNGPFLAGSEPPEGTPPLVCPCCDGGEFTPIVRQVRSVYAAKPYDIVRCRGCGHGVTVPLSRPEELQAIYDRVYFYDAHYAVMGEKAYHARFLADDIARLRPSMGTFRVLEVGCMFGTLLRELADRGIAAQGIELSEEPVRYCRDRNLEVSCESVEQFVGRVPNERFQVVVLSHVLEHLVDPRGIIRQLAGLLTEGGHLVVCVPNYQCWHARLAGRNWGWWQVPVHVNHFCESSARRFFESLGFEDIRTRLRGGDSLTILLTVMNALGANKVGGPGALSATKWVAVKGLSVLLRGYHRIGGDELVIVCRSRPDRSQG